MSRGGPLGPKGIAPYAEALSRQLDDEPLADFLRFVAVVMENGRGFFASLAQDGFDGADTFETVYRRFIAELWRRSMELETMPPSRGTA